MLVSSVSLLLFIGTDAACLPAGWFAINHSYVYQNLLCSFHLFLFYFLLVQMLLACRLAGSLLIILMCIKICYARFI
jgi:hypothetical protein